MNQLTYLLTGKPHPDNTECEEQLQKLRRQMFENGTLIREQVTLNVLEDNLGLREAARAGSEWFDFDEVKE